MRTHLLGLAAAVGLFAGCGGSKQAAFPDLHPVKGVVKRDGQPVKGGTVQFAPDPANPDYLINAEVGADGAFVLNTVRANDSKGERKSGAPAGTYAVTYTPTLADQTAGGQVNPIELKDKVTVKAGDNDLTLELPKK